MTHPEWDDFTADELRTAAKVARCSYLPAAAAWDKRAEEKENNQ